MVRKFEQKPIPEDVLRRVLDVARHAPSGGFSQGFDFVVLAKPEERDWFYHTTDDPTDPDPFPGREPAVAPACIVLPFANKRLYLERYAQADKIQFGMDKEENMAAAILDNRHLDGEGLGAWYFFISRGEADVMRELRVPSYCLMLGVIALGYPAPEEPSRSALFAKRRRAFENMFHFGRW